MTKLKVDNKRKVVLFVVYYPEGDLYLSEENCWVLEANGAKLFKSRSLARKASKNFREKSLRIIRWNIEEEIVE
jgi:hypothetical protein